MLVFLGYKRHDVPYPHIAGNSFDAFVKKAARDMGITEFTVTAIETSEDIAKLCAEA